MSKSKSGGDVFQNEGASCFPSRPKSGALGDYERYLNTFPQLLLRPSRSGRGNQGGLSGPGLWIENSHHHPELRIASTTYRSQRKQALPSRQDLKSILVCYEVWERRHRRPNHAKAPKTSIAPTSIQLKSRCIASGEVIVTALGLVFTPKSTVM